MRIVQCIPGGEVSILGGRVRCAECNGGATIQTEEHWWDLTNSHPKLRSMER